MTPMERYYWYKSHGICTSCRHNDAWKGQALCLECRMSVIDKRKDNPPKLSTEQKYNHAQHQKRRRDLLVAFGVCLELKEYNKKHGTHYSYGQYTSLVKLGKINNKREQLI